MEQLLTRCLSNLVQHGESDVLQGWLGLETPPPCHSFGKDQIPIPRFLQTSTSIFLKKSKESQSDMLACHEVATFGIQAIERNNRPPERALELVLIFCKGPSIDSWLDADHGCISASSCTDQRPVCGRTRPHDCCGQRLDRHPGEG